MNNAELKQAAHELIDDLVELRLNRGLSQTVVAERMGTTRSNVSAYEHHRRMPGMAVLIKYANAVGAEITFVTRRSGQ